jgi:hypothetical protein
MRAESHIKYQIFCLILIKTWNVSIEFTGILQYKISPSSAEVKNGGAIPYTPPYFFMA